MFDFLSNKFSSIFSRLTGQSVLTQNNVQEALQKIREALLQADVPYALVDQFLQEVSTEIVGQKVLSSLKPGEYFVKIVHDKLVTFLGGQQGAEFTFQIPSTVMVMGLQGSGKTTTLAKLASMLIKQAQQRGKTRNILLASVDFYRPAAIDQLEILAKQVGASFYRATSTDPIVAAQEISRYFKQYGFDILMLDTAGRLHVDQAMLQEIRIIDNQLQPKYKFLVLDAMTGQESLCVAQAFEDALGFNGAILTKMDSDTRGGAAFGFKYSLKKQILFVGIGEKIDDLEAFRPERMAGRILGMGDIQSLLERAQEKIKHADQESLHKSLSHGKITLLDFAQQLDMVSKMGSFSQIVKYLPGMNAGAVSPELLQKGELEIKRFKAIISSMTHKERIYPKILDRSRKERIARGAGVKVADINILLERFEQSQQFVKLFKKFGR